MWVLIFIIFIIFNIISFFVPKRIGRIEIYATCFFAYAYGLTTDIVLDLHYHLYGYFEKGFQWKSLLGILLYFPSISFLFLNYYPTKRKIAYKALYIILWSIFSVIFEWFTVQTEFFYYSGWKLWYSAPVYPLIFVILVINMKFVQRLTR